MKTALYILPKMMGSVALLALLAGGCTTVNTVERANPVAQKQMVADKRVITDHSLIRKVRIVGINESTAGDHLKIQIEVQNSTRSLQNFSYRVEWYDENAMLIASPTGIYIPKQIEGRESMFIVAIAPTPKAKDFRIKFIEP